MKISQKNQLRILISLFVVLYSFIIFMANDSYDGSFWLIFSFTLLPLIAIFGFTFCEEKFLTRFAFNSLLGLILGICFIVQIVVNLFYFIARFSFTVAVWIEIPLLLIAAIVFVMMLMSVNKIQENLERQSKKVNYLNKVQVALTVSRNSASNREIIKMLDRLIDEVKYSEYNSNDDVAELEIKILNISQELTMLSDEEQIKETIKKIDVLVKQRNQTVILGRR